jgi:hypothetical protein
MQRDKLVGSLAARAPSPWDKFSASPSPCSEGPEIEMRRSDGIPKLAPEVEQVRRWRGPFAIGPWLIGFHIGYFDQGERGI